MNLCPRMCSSFLPTLKLLELRYCIYCGVTLHNINMQYIVLSNNLI